MKKPILLILIVFGLINVIVAQNNLIDFSNKQNYESFVSSDNSLSRTFISPSEYIFYEGFDECTLPNSWYRTDFECTWSFSYQGTEAAWPVPYRGNCYAMAKDVICGTDMIDIRLVTPNIDLTLVDAAVLQFETFKTSDICEVQVTLDQGTSYTTILTLEDTDYSDGWQIIEVSLDDFVGYDEVRISFTYSQNQSWGYGWAIDDIAVFEPLDYDLYVSNVSPVLTASGEAVFPEVEIGNSGFFTQNDFDIQLEISDGTSTVYSSILNVTGAALAYGTSDTFTMTDEWSNPEIGNYFANVIVSASGDENIHNNEASFELNVVESFESYYIDGTYNDVFSLILPFGDAINIADYSGPFPYAMEYADGTYYIVANDSKLYSFDVLTGLLTEIGNITGLSSFLPTGLAYDWINELMYISAVDMSNVTHICTIDLETAVMTEVGVATGANLMIAIEFDNLHNLYGISIETDQLYKISTVDGSATNIGNIGIDLSYGQDISYNMATGIMYGCLYGEGDDKGLYQINLDDATTELILFYESQIGAFAIPYDNIIEPEFISYGFEEQIESAIIDYDSYTINVTMPNGYSIDNLIADFVLPYSVTATVGGVEQESGISANDFTGSVTYLLSVDGGDSYEWIINVYEQILEEGSECDNAINFGVVGSPIYNGFLDVGEEHWYKFTIEEDFQDILISLCASDFNTKLDLFTSCTSSYPYIYNDNSCADYQSEIEFNTLVVGEYFVRVAGFAGAYGNYSLAIGAAIRVDDGIESELQIYPNPSNGLVKFCSNEEVNITILDLTGKIIDEFAVMADGEFQFEGTPGIYSIVILSRSNRIVKKLIIQ